MKKSTPLLYIVIILVIGLIGWQRGWFSGRNNSMATAGSAQNDVPATTTTSHHEASSGLYHLNRANRVVYTRHARCRMGCRHITAGEVKEIIASGVINEAKSNPEDKPCPTIALEGYSSEGQHLRIVVATCGDELHIVTCIDLGKDWPCHCE